MPAGDGLERVDLDFASPISIRGRRVVFPDDFLRFGVNLDNGGVIPLYSGGDEPDIEAIARTNALLADLPHPFAAVILGMGNDGHTASFFPGGDTLDEALKGQGPTLAIRAPGAGEPRITFTLPRLLDTDGLYLHIEGEEKAAVLDRALGDGPVGDMPIRAVLRSGAPVTVYWCP